MYVYVYICVYLQEPISLLYLFGKVEYLFYFILLWKNNTKITTLRHRPLRTKICQANKTKEAAKEAAKEHKAESTPKQSQSAKQSQAKRHGADELETETQRKSRSGAESNQSSAQNEMK